MKPWSRNVHSSVRLRLQADAVTHPGITGSVMKYDTVTGVYEPDCAPQIPHLTLLWEALVVLQRVFGVDSWHVWSVQDVGRAWAVS